MNTFKGAIFDLDGTLAYTLPDLHKSMNLMLEHENLPLRSEEDILKAINTGAFEFVRQSLPLEKQNDHDYVAHCLEVYTGIYEQHYIEKTCLFDGIADALAYLKSKGIILACFSNKQHEHVQTIVETLLPIGTFDYILGQTALPTKPDPIGAFKIAGELDLRPSEIAYVGDSDVDMKTAVNAHMFPIGVSWGYRSVDILQSSGAKAIAYHADELKKIIANQI